MTAVAYAHPTISRFAIADCMLHIGGLPVGLLAERADTTPFFAYERTGLTRRVEELRRALPDDIHLSYAVNANPMPAVVQHLSRQVDGFDVASAGEMAVGLDTPIPANRVSFAGPGKTPAELSRAVAARVTISLESETAAIASRVPRSAPLWRSFRRLRHDGPSHSVPRPSDTDAAVGVDRRPPGLHER